MAVEQWEGVVYQEKHVAAMTLLALLRWRGWGGGALCRWSTAAKRLFTVAPCWSVAHRSNPALPRGRVAVG